MARLEPDGPAARAGLREGDVLLSLDGQPIGGLDDLLRHLSEEAVGRPLAIKALRGAGLHSFDVTPNERPAD